MSPIDARRNPSAAKRATAAVRIAARVRSPFDASLLDVPPFDAAATTSTRAICAPTLVNIAA